MPTGVQWTIEKKKIVKNLYETFEGGYFKKLLEQKSCKTNYEKALHWGRFTSAYNQVPYQMFLLWLHCLTFGKYRTVKVVQLFFTGW